MDQKSSLSIAKQTKTVVKDDVIKEFSKHSNIVWFETISTEDHSEKERKFENFGYHHLEELSQFIWFEDNPAPININTIAKIENDIDVKSKPKCLKYCDIYQGIL